MCAFYTKFEGLFKFFLQSIDTFMCACVLFTIISFVVSAQCFQHSKRLNVSALGCTLAPRLSVEMSKTTSIPFVVE